MQQRKACTGFACEQVAVQRQGIVGSATHCESVWAAPLEEIVPSYGHASLVPAPEVQVGLHTDVTFTRCAEGPAAALLRTMLSMSRHQAPGH